MKLSKACKLYQKNNMYRVHIDSIYAMSYNLYWDNNIDINILTDTLEKVTCKNVAKKIISAIIADQKVFE